MVFFSDICLNAVRTGRYQGPKFLPRYSSLISAHPASPTFSEPSLKLTFPSVFTDLSLYSFAVSTASGFLYSCFLSACFVLQSSGSAGQQWTYTTRMVFFKLLVMMSIVRNDIDPAKNCLIKLNKIGNTREKYINYFMELFIFWDIIDIYHCVSLTCTT